MAAVLEVRELIKRYAGVRAVDGVSFAVEEGICFGLLGPNGAGKTTTIEILEGIAHADGGEVLYRGRPIAADFRRVAGIQFQETALQEHLSVREQIELFQRFYPRCLPVAELADLCSLHEYLDRDARKLSGGQRQRLLLALALVNDPDVVFLDEPTTGLDPQARRHFWDLVRAIKARRKTILLTTHYMEEAYQLCDDIAIMDHGRIIARGSPDALLAEHFSDVVLELPREALPPELPELPGRVLETPGTLEIFTADVNATVAALLHTGASLARLRIRPRTLEDLFLELTGQELRA